MIGNDHEPGVIQYALRDLFDATSQDGSCARVIRLSYLELYNEQLYDLLDSERQPFNISFQEDVRVTLVRESASIPNRTHEPVVFGRYGL